MNLQNFIGSFSVNSTVGYLDFASGIDSIAIGTSTLANKANTTAMGTEAKATGENAKTYRIAKEQTKLIGKNVINAFKDALKAETGWNKHNVPEETQKDMYEVGKYVFMITTSPKESVKYGNAAKKFISFVEDSGEFVRIRDSNEYLPVDVLVEKYNQLVEENTNMTVQQNIDVMPQPKYDQVMVE